MQYFCLIVTLRGHFWHLVRAIATACFLFTLTIGDCWADTVELVADFNQELNDLEPSSVAFVNGRYFFVADEGSGNELYTYKENESLKLTKKIHAGDLGSDPSNLTSIGNILYFYADDGVSGRELWRSDGTESGTFRVSDIAPGSLSSISSTNPSSIIALGNSVYFAASDGTATNLWKSDGTELGTQVAYLINGSGVSSNPANLVRLGNKLLFTAISSSGDGLWSADGSLAGLQLLAVISNGSGNVDDELITGNDSAIYFWANDGVHGKELWRSDGTPAGTVMVRDINLAGSAAIADPNKSPGGIIVDGRLFFAADDGVNGAELWVSDGSSGGTTLCVEFKPGAEGSYPASTSTPQLSLVAKGNQLLVSHKGVTPESYDALSIVNTDNCTVAQSTVFSYSPLKAVTVAGKYLILSTWSGGSDYDPYGNSMVKLKLHSWSGVGMPTEINIPFGAGYSPNSTFYENQQYAYLRHLLSKAGSSASLIAFTKLNGAWSNWLWSSDGTVAGTVPQKKLVTTSSRSAYVQSLTAIDGGALAVVNNSSNPLSHLVQIPASEGGLPIQLLTNVNQVPSGGTQRLYPLFSFNGLKWLIRSNKISFTDGSPQGSGEGISVSAFEAVAPVKYGNEFVFISNSTLKISDGTLAGTRDFLPAGLNLQVSGYFDDFGLQVVGGRILFNAKNSAFGNEIWASDGTFSGTYLVKDINPGPANGLLVAFDYLPGWPPALVGNTLFFFANDGVHGAELWKTDGTAAGTQLVKDIIPGPVGSVDSNYLYLDFEMIAFKNKVFFVANDQQGAVNLWRSDGSEEGTNPVPLLNSDPIPQALTVVGSELFMVSSGHLTKTDGELALGSAISISPIHSKFSFWPKMRLTAHKGLVYFFDTDEYGRELWRSNGTLEGTIRLTDIGAGLADSIPVLPDYVPPIISTDKALFFIGQSPSVGAELFRVVSNQIDLCPNDDGKIVPETCGCGVRDNDDDHDNTPNCIDLCPTDQFKTTPLQCGCGNSDGDSDNDGTPDCLDQCKFNPNLTKPNVCGCIVNCLTPGALSTPTPPAVATPTPTPSPGVEVLTNGTQITFLALGPSGAKYMIEIESIVNAKNRTKIRKFKLVLSSKKPLIKSPRLKRGQYRVRSWYVIQGKSSKKTKWVKFKVTK